MGSSQIRFFTRRATDYTAQYGPVFAALLRERVRAHTAILDGEMLAWDTRREAFVPFGENRTVAGEERAGASEGRQLVRWSATAQPKRSVIAHERLTVLHVV